MSPGHVLCKQTLANGEIGHFVRKFGIGETFHSEDWEDFVRHMNDMFENFTQGGFGYSFTRCIEENSWAAMASIISGIYTGPPFNERINT